MADRYPGYDVLNKRHTPSWNAQTRRVIDTRLAIDPHRHRFFDGPEWLVVCAVCSRILPQPTERARAVPLAAMLDMKLYENGADGYRDARLPPPQNAWRIGVRAIEAEAMSRFRECFHKIASNDQDQLLNAVQSGQVAADNWHGMPPALFFTKRLLHDLTSLYYAHPTAWNEIGFGGPSSPRGYVRMNYDRRDPWEAIEARPGEEEKTRGLNAHVG